MTSTRTTTRRNSGRFLSSGWVLFIVFLVLKLVGVISWPWWLVTVPLWGLIAFLLVFYLLLAITALVIAGIAKALHR